MGVDSKTTETCSPGAQEDLIMGRMTRYVTNAPLKKKGFEKELNIRIHTSVGELTL
jgi:hypothetical protein